MRNALEDIFLSDDQVRDIVDTLDLKKNVVLQGLQELAKLCSTDYVLIGEKAFKYRDSHQSYSYEDFVQGLRPDPNSNSTGFKLTNGKFYQFCQSAKNHLMKNLFSS